jgi:hypothetical protein
VRDCAAQLELGLGQPQVQALGDLADVLTQLLESALQLGGVRDDVALLGAEHDTLACA